MYIYIYIRDWDLFISQSRCSPPHYTVKVAIKKYSPPLVLSSEHILTIFKNGSRYSLLQPVVNSSPGPGGWVMLS